MKRIIEFERDKVLQYETHESLEFLDEKFQAIDENFYNIEFSCQRFNNENQLQSEYIYKLPKSILDKAVVNLDNASDEFFLELTEEVTVQEFERPLNNTARIELVKRKCLPIEVVTEGIAEDNDMDFMGRAEYKRLLEAGEYEVGGINSYYKPLGTVNGNTYFYREL